MSDRPRVLVCDDEPHIVRALKVVMREAGFEALPAESAAQALQVATLQRPDAAILDLLLPDGDGVEVCRAIREWSDMPILVLSAVGDEDHKVRALEAGADDYVTKPFSPRELVARVRALLRRVERAAQLADERRAAEEESARLDLGGGLVVDVAARRVEVGGAEVHLTRTEFDLLHALARRPGHAVGRDRLLTDVWAWPEAPSGAAATRAVDSHVKALRRKIGAERIRTVHGVGYALEPA